ncbi:hypothetical protein C2G38_2188085 [Gigaspora rosea]|uniref:Uncharacterized protein n=1 Tax=Gigaspora rosea TaxID=44941 RepID=A0A397V695_9GLOM|nr:hypothetical protein C2G38_2188085 [Gigaspora rosea]
MHGNICGYEEKEEKEVTDKEKVEEEEVDEDEARGAEDDNMIVPEGKQVEKESKVEEAWLKSDRDYTIKKYLLGRVFRMFRQNNPELAGDKKRYAIVPPSVHREGNKKTIFANFSDICKSGSIDGSQRLVIRGRFVQKR